MLATETTAPAYMPPLPAGLADLPTPELMAIVMRRVGEGCTLADFQQAAETCDLTEARLNANIGAATRIIMLDGQRNDQPGRPLAPWDADPSYRADLVRQGGRIVATGLADSAAIVDRLEQGGIEVPAIIALYDEIITEAIHQMNRRPRLGLLAGIIADLDAAVAAYDTGDLNAEARQLAKSMRAALDGLRANQELPRTHVLATLRAFAATEHWGGIGRQHQPKVEAALALLTKLWGM